MQENKAELLTQQLVDSQLYIKIIREQRESMLDQLTTMMVDQLKYKGKINDLVVALEKSISEVNNLKSNLTTLERKSQAIERHIVDFHANNNKKDFFTKISVVDGKIANFVMDYPLKSDFV